MEAKELRNGKTAEGRSRQQTADPDWSVIGKASLSEEWKKRILAEMDRHIGLSVSVESLASEFIDDIELPHFLNGQKPIIPVRLGVLTTPAPRSRFLHRQFVELPKKKMSCSPTAKRERTKTAAPASFHVLRIVAAIAEWRGWLARRCRRPRSRKRSLPNCPTADWPASWTKPPTSTTPTKTPAISRVKAAASASAN